MRKSVKHPLKIGRIDRAQRSDPIPEVRRSPRKRAHALFETSPTKEGTTQDQMMGERARLHWHMGSRLAALSRAGQNRKRRRD